jgi:hypothetical protein
MMQVMLAAGAGSERAHRTLAVGQSPSYSRGLTAQGGAADAILAQSGLNRGTPTTPTPKPPW